MFGGKTGGTMKQDGMPSFFFFSPSPQLHTRHKRALAHTHKGRKEQSTITGAILFFHFSTLLLPHPSRCHHSSPPALLGCSLFDRPFRPKPHPLQQPALSHPRSLSPARSTAWTAARRCRRIRHMRMLFGFDSKLNQ